MTESTLYVLLLCCCCCCCLTVNAKCWVECPKSQKSLSEPECLLKDDGTSTSCHKSISNSEITGHSIPGLKYVSVSIDLSPRILRLYLYNRVGGKLEVGATRSHLKIAGLEIYYGFTCIRPALFNWLPNLRHLVLSQILFQYFPPFSQMNPSLTYLRIEFASFALSVSNDSSLRVSELMKLKYLFLSPNQFLHATDQSFSGLTSLTYLHLERIHIPNPVATFSPLVRLNELHYTTSALVDISFLEQTPSLYGLVHLSLYDNRITSIQSNTFSRYSLMTKLNLEYNFVSLLERNCFKGLRRLIELYLGSNHLREMNRTSFEGLESLTGIRLRNNPISHLSSRIFEYLPNLATLQLYGLPLHCECSLQWMSKVNLNIYNSRCTTPPQHFGKEATDASIYVNCTQELSYQCFTRSVRCPTGSYCQDTLYNYACICEEKKDLFVKPLNQCLSYEQLTDHQTKRRPVSRVSLRVIT